MHRRREISGKKTGIGAITHSAENQTDPGLVNYRDFTARIVRQTVEKDFSLDHGTLDAPEYKEAIKAAMKSALVRMCCGISCDT